VRKKVCSLENDPHQDVNTSSDPFDEVAKVVLATLKKRGGRVEFSEIEKWTEFIEVGKYTLRTVVNELIEVGKLKAPEGFYDSGEELEPPIPKVVELPYVSDRDVKRMKEYLCDYWSVGELRLFDDMCRFGVKDVNKVLKELTEAGYAELTPSSVVNATEKLRKESESEKGSAKGDSKLSDLVRF
jgi:hypothetical protein